ncbi:MAG: IS66 family transposase, partial [Gallionella sp.]
PLARTGELMGTIFDLPMSDATVLAIQKEAGQRLTLVVAEIADALKAAPTIHVDETGMYVAGDGKWMHIVATESLTWMGAHEKRGKVAFDALGVLADATGVLIHDGLPAYRLFSDAVHGLCNQHHLRELLFVAEEMQQDWAKHMMELLRAACHEVNESPDKILTAERIAHYRLAYEVILQAGETANPPAAKVAGKRGKTKQNKAFNLLRRLRGYADDVWRFTENPHVPFTNNIAEHAVRMPKVKQKISGGFRTMQGLEIFCTIRSYLATLHKQGANIFDALIQTFRESPPPPRFA